ncbi:MAG: divisome protein SepX/GlpR [Pseudonocardiaceae bacterium]
MPSSLIFAALAGAWLVVLVPIVAKRRQEVVRTAESALAARVLRRPDLSRPAVKHGQEAPMIGGRVEQQEPVSDERRYRSGRGGYDPEVAAQLARAKYVFRQRVVLGLVIVAGATAILAYTVSSLLWWLHAASDVAVIGYLGYLRRQVRIEEEVRRRRAARLTGPRERASVTDDSQEVEAFRETVHDKDEPAQQPSSRSDAAPPVPHSTAVALDCDDEDPAFDELQPAFEPPYRRAVGE